MTADGGALAGPVSATVRLQFLDYRIDVQTNSLRLATRLQSYFRGFLAVPGARSASARLEAIVGPPGVDATGMAAWRRPAAGGRPPKESFRDVDGGRQILKNRTGVLISLHGDDATIIGDLRENANQVVNLVGTLFGLSLMRKGYVMLHGSAVSTDAGEASVFLGNSGSGKSSLALQMIERGGFEFISNDRVLLRSTGDGIHVVGLPKRPRVNPGTLLASRPLARLMGRAKRRSYRALTHEELWKLEEKTDVDIEGAFGAGTRLEARLACVFSLEWRVGGAGLLTAPLDTDGALAAMRATAKDFGPFDLLREERDLGPEYRKIAKASTFWRVEGKADPTKLARQLAKAQPPFQTPRARALPRARTPRPRARSGEADTRAPRAPAPRK